MKKILIWDLPTRVFHWMLAGAFIFAFAIANLADDDGQVFTLHMLLGALMALMVLLRIVWGFFGSHYARFGSFAFGPSEIWAYVKSTFSSEGKRYLGHNPGSSIAIWAMFALTFGLALTGIYMSSFEVLKDVHEIMANVFVAVVITHVAGVIWHSLRHQENITLSMINGRKDGDSSSAIPNAHPVVAVFFVAIIAASAATLVQNYDAKTQMITVPVLGNTIQLGEAGHHGDHIKSKDHEDE